MITCRVDLFAPVNYGMSKSCLVEGFTVRTARRRLSGRGLLGGMAAGAILGVLLGIVTGEWPRPAYLTIADQFRGIAACAALVAILGGLASGVLSRDGWQMLAGAVVGAIATGLFGVVATLHIKGLIYSFIGVPLGAVAVYLFCLAPDSAVPMAKAKDLPKTEGIWDRELDR
jgi:hypothetical protein